MEIPDFNELGQVCDFANARIEAILELSNKGLAPELSEWERNCVPKVQNWISALQSATPEQQIQMAAETLDTVNLGVETILVVSTCHITEDTAGVLEVQASGDEKTIEGLILYAKGDFGWMIWVGSTYADDIKDAPPDLDLLLKYCTENRIGWLMLDRDGPEHPAFPSYEW